MDSSIDFTDKTDLFDNNKRDSFDNDKNNIITNKEREIERESISSNKQ